MNKIWIIAILIFLKAPLKTYSQIRECKFEVDSLANERIYTSFDKAPSFGNSNKDLPNYIAKNFKYPQHYTISESLIASFIIQADGKPTNFKLLKKSKYDFVNNNYIDFLKSMPNWNPAYCDAKAVTAKYILPLSLGLSRK